MAGPDLKAPFEDASISPSDAMEKKQNLAALAKVFQDLKIEKVQEILQNIKEGKRNALISYHGTPFYIAFNDLGQVTFFKDQLSGSLISFDDPLNPQKLPSALASALEIPEIILKNMGFNLPPDTTFTAEGTSRFSFHLKNPDKTLNTYLVIADNHGIMGRVYQYQETEMDPDSGRLKRNYQTLDKSYQVEETVIDSETFQLAFYATGIQPPSLTQSEKGISSYPKYSANPMAVLPKSVSPVVPKIAPSAWGKSLSLSKPEADSLENQLGFQAVIKAAPSVSPVRQKPDQIRVFKDGEVRGITSFVEESLYMPSIDQTLSYSCTVIENFEYLENDQFMIKTEKQYPPEIMKLQRAKIINKTMTIYNADGKAVEGREYDNDGNLYQTVKYSYNETSTSQVVVDQKGKPLMNTVTMKIPGSVKGKARVFFYDQKGGQLSDYFSEQERNPHLTIDQYISKLADILDTPEKWQHFIDDYFQYEWDTSDWKDPRKIGKKESTKEYLANPKAWNRDREKEPLDYYQTPAETLLRLDPGTGKIQGDCDDISLLAQAILVKQGIKSEVIHVTKHHVCVYIMKRPDGAYDAYHIGTDGFIKNGKRFHQMGEATKAGFKTPEEALDSIYDFFDEKDPEFRRADHNVLSLKLDMNQEERFNKSIFNLKSISDFTN